MSRKHVCALLTLSSALLSDVQAVEVVCTPKGIEIAAGGEMGKVLLEYPTLGDQRAKPTGVTVGGVAAADLTYADGTQVKVQLLKGTDLRFAASHLSDAAKSISFAMTLPLAWAGKAQWAIGPGAPDKAFPADATKDAFLFKGDAKRLAIADGAGGGFQLVLPHGFQQLQDNRVWGTSTLQWISFSALPRTGAEAFHTVRILALGADAAATPEPVATAKPAATPSSDRFAVTPTDKGVAIEAGGMGTFTLAYPELELTGGKKLKPAETRVEGNRAVLKYAEGGEIVVSAAGGKIDLAFGTMPVGTKSLSLSTFIPPNYGDGGSWRIGDQTAMFPKDRPAKPHLYQGHARTFDVVSFDNKRLNLGVPENTYQQLQDNREWGWNIFWWGMTLPYNTAHKSEQITVAFDASGAQRVVLVDRFGQTTKRDFPGKVRDVAELTADVAADEAYFASFAPPATDRFGGKPGTGEKLGLKKTGFFHVESKTVAGRDLWVLVNPDGNATFHLGVCSFGPGEDYTFVEGREDVYEWLPPHAGEYATTWNPDTYWNPRAASFYKANVVRKYGTAFDDAANAGRMIDRVRRIGFNAIGAFSGGSPTAAAKGFPRVGSLPLGQWSLGPAVPGVRGVFDPFDEKNLAKMDELFAKSVAEKAGDPLLIGYFLDNEQGFEDIPRAIPALPGKHASKRKLVAMLQEKYKDIAAFNTAWGLDAVSFEALADRGLPLTTKAAFADMQVFTEMFLDAYYRSVTETFHRYDRNHMLIGNRWQPGTANNETLCRVAGKYMDVISINYYTCGIDAPFIRRLYEWSGRKPQMWTEFYFTAEKESNVSASGMDMATQQERGLAYRHYVEGAAALGFVVGVEWFTLIDQAVTGRFFEKLNGERNNTGLFNVADRPYKPLFAEMVKTHDVLYDVWLEGKAPYLLDNPRFSGKPGATRRTVSAGRPTGPMKIDGQLEGWPGRPPERVGGERLSTGRESGGTEAAFKLCWDDTHLYLLANITDPSLMKNEHEGDHLWSGDGLELFIGSEKLDQGGTFLFTDRQVLLGGGKAGQAHVVNLAAQVPIETAVVPSVDGKGYTLEAAIPWTALAIAPKDGTELLFDIAVDNSADGKGRDCQLMWNGGARNSSDRSAWGRLTLVP